MMAVVFLFWAFMGQSATSFKEGKETRNDNLYIHFVYLKEEEALCSAQWPPSIAFTAATRCIGVDFAANLVIWHFRHSFNV